MLIYVINLDRRTDRLAAMQEQFAALGIDFQRIPAIDGLTEPQPVIRYRDDLTASEIACHRSHRLCWQALVDSNQSHALIFEDDVLVAPQLIGLLGRPDFVRADVVRLEVTLTPARFWARGRQRVDGILMWRPVTIQFGSAAYILSRSCAAQLLKEDASTLQPVDSLLFGRRGGVLGRFTVLQTDPGLCMQVEAGSPIAVSDIKASRQALGRDEEDPSSLPSRPQRSVLTKAVRNGLRAVHLRLAKGIFEKTIPFAGGPVPGRPLAP